VARMSPLRGGIIAAGDGTRLRQAGWSLPKPLVPVEGQPLIERVIRNFRAAGVTSLVVIVNDAGRSVVEWACGRFPDVRIDFIVKTTGSSLESFGEVLAASGDDRVLISTVDAWCDERDFVRFVEAASTRPPAATVLGVTPFVADEKPLWVSLDVAGRITRLGAETGELVTAGFYLMPAAVHRGPIPAGLPRLRDFLAWLVAAGQPVYGEVIETVVDVDRAEDLALAAAMTLEPGPARSRGAIA
jgi:NDP-sugar pyrophosphorylase family protein